MYLSVLGNSILQIICPVVLGGLWSLYIFDKDDHYLHVLYPILSNKGYNHLEARHLQHVQNTSSNGPAILNVLNGRSYIGDILTTN